MHASRKPPLRLVATDSSAASHDADVSEVKLAPRQTRKDKPTVVYKLADSHIPRSGSSSGASSPDVFSPKPSLTPKVVTPVLSKSKLASPVIAIKKLHTRSVPSQTDNDQAAAGAAPVDTPPQPPPPSPPLPDPNRDMSQPADPPPIQISGDGALLPSPFEGRPNEDSSKWLSYFKQYCQYKAITDKPPQIELFKLLMRGQAHDWFIGLTDETDTFQKIEALFNQRYSTSPLVKFKMAKELYSRRQAVNESCDDYVTAMQQIARKMSTEINEEMLRFAILNGLLPQIASYVVAKAPKSVPELLEIARVAELTLPPENNNGPMMNQLNEVQAEIRRLSKQLERQTTSYVSDRRSPTPERRQVSFAPSASTASASPNPSRRVFDRSQQRNDSRSQPTSSSSPAAANTCDRCGYVHRYPTCPAADKKCFRCGLKGHLISRCRSANHDNRKQQ